VKQLEDRIRARWGSRTPSWPRRAIQHAPGCGRGIPQRVPGPAHPCPPPLSPYYWRPNRRRAEVPADPIGRDPAGPCRRHPPAANDPSMRPVALSVRRGVASVTMCRRRLRRSCRAFRDQSTAATTMPSLRRTRPTHRPRRRPPGTPRPAVMEPQPCLSTAFLHRTHLGVFHVEHARKMPTVQMKNLVYP
jgi:hypothetical protein